MRGKVVHTKLHRGIFRITPAYAGKSSSSFSSNSGLKDHPRLCGEKPTAITHARAMPGSPPPMRGKGGFFCFLAVIIGITPAYAGKSVHVTIFRFRNKDHPRLCGEKYKV